MKRRLTESNWRDYTGCCDNSFGLGQKRHYPAAPSIYQGAKNALASVQAEAEAKAPTAFAATEAATSFSGGAAGAEIEELFPDNGPTADDDSAEILGAVRRREILRKQQIKF